MKDYLLRKKIVFIVTFFLFAPLAFVAIGFPIIAVMAACSVAALAVPFGAYRLKLSLQ